MKRILLSVLLLTVFSCDYFDKQKVYSEDLLQDELKAFNWNEVDEYPTFSSCDQSMDKARKKQCFETTLRQVLNAHLAKQSIVVNETIDDTVNLKIVIDREGELSISAISFKDKTKQEIPQLDSILGHSFDSLPKILPAIKRSQQVTTQFDFPIIIKIE